MHAAPSDQLNTPYFLNQAGILFQTSSAATLRRSVIGDKTVRRAGICVEFGGLAIGAATHRSDLSFSSGVLLIAVPSGGRRLALTRRYRLASQSNRNKATFVLD